MRNLQQTGTAELLESGGEGTDKWFKVEGGVETLFFSNFFIIFIKVWGGERAYLCQLLQQLLVLMSRKKRNWSSR